MQINGLRRPSMANGITVHSYPACISQLILDCVLDLKRSKELRIIRHNCSTCLARLRLLSNGSSMSIIKGICIYRHKRLTA